MCSSIPESSHHYDPHSAACTILADSMSSAEVEQALVDLFDSAMESARTTSPARSDHPWRTGRHARASWAGAMVLSALACTALGSPLLLTVPMLLGGLAVSPVLILGSTSVKALAPRRILNEAFTWTSSCVTVATGLGSLVGGWLIDSLSPATGFTVAAVGGAVVLVIALRVPRQSLGT